MYVCPACNGLDNVEKTCEVCQSNMYDKGRVVDYFDDYSPYWEDDDAKLVDGLLESKVNHICLHVFHCPTCNQESQVSIQEQIR